MKQEDTKISKISYNDLIVFSQDSTTNQITGYKLKLDDVTVDDSAKVVILQKQDQLRRFSRANRNLEKAIQAFDEIESMLNQYGTQVGFNILPHSLFCYAVTLYGACFVKDNKYLFPLREIYEELIKSNNVHDEITPIGI